MANHRADPPGLRGHRHRIDDVCFRQIPDAGRHVGSPAAHPANSLFRFHGAGQGHDAIGPGPQPDHAQLCLERIADVSFLIHQKISGDLARNYPIAYFNINDWYRSRTGERLKTGTIYSEARPIWVAYLSLGLMDDRRLCLFLLATREKRARITPNASGVLFSNSRYCCFGRGH